MFHSPGRHEDVMARLAELGVIDINGLHTLADVRKQLRDFLKDACGADPANGGFKHTVEPGKVVSEWEQSGKRVEIENKRDAERLASNLPPQLRGEEVLLLKKQYEVAFNKKRPITKAQCPSRPYLELKVGHAETLWEAEKLTEVTSLAQAERHATANSDKRFGRSTTATR